MSRQSFGCERLLLERKPGHGVGSISHGFSESVRERRLASAPGVVSQSAARRASRRKLWRSVLVVKGLAVRLRRCRGIAVNSNAACRTSRAGERRGQSRDCNFDLRIS